LEYGVVLPKRTTTPWAQFASKKETIEIKRRRGTTDTPNNASNGCVKHCSKADFPKTRSKMVSTTV